MKLSRVPCTIPSSLLVIHFKYSSVRLLDLSMIPGVSLFLSGTLSYVTAPHCRTLAWKFPWTEEPGRLKSIGSLRIGHGERLHFHFSLSCTGEGNGNPLQCSCLENLRDGGAWWAAVCGGCTELDTTDAT